MLDNVLSLTALFWERSDTMTMELSGLISTAKNLPENEQKRVAAILGALVADAAGEDP